jgi:hypothetical protein
MDPAEKFLPTLSLENGNRSSLWNMFYWNIRQWSKSNISVNPSVIHHHQKLLELFIEAVCGVYSRTYIVQCRQHVYAGGIISVMNKTQHSIGIVLVLGAVCEHIINTYVVLFCK